MSAKKATKKSRTQNSVKTVRGRPFKPGHTAGFKPGVSGNPGGRPKSRRFAEAARRWLEAPSEKDPNKSNADALVDHWGREAFKDAFALQQLLDRAEGRPETGIKMEVSDKRQDVAERAIAGVMSETGVSREEAITGLRRVAPEIEWPE